MIIRTFLADCGFKVVRTNIEEGLPTPKERRRAGTTDVSLGELIKNADVIFLCEVHSTEKYLQANSRLVNHIWNRHYALVTEANAAEVHIPYSYQRIQKTATQWDDDSFGEEEMDFVKQQQIILLNEGKSVIDVVRELSSIVLLAQKREGNLSRTQILAIQTCIARLRNYSTFAALREPQERNLKGLEQLLKKISRHWISHYNEIEKALEDAEDIGVEERNRLLANSVMDKLNQGARKVIAFAGVAHLKVYSRFPDWKNPVESLYKTMEEQSIRYVTLKATKQKPLEVIPPYDLRKKRTLEEETSSSKRIKQEKNEGETTTDFCYSDGCSYVLEIMEILSDFNLLEIGDADCLIREFKTYVFDPIINHGLRVFDSSFQPYDEEDIENSFDQIGD